MRGRRLAALAAGSLLTLLVASPPPAAIAATAGPTAAAPIAAVNSIWAWQARPAADLADVAADLQVSRVYLFVGARSHDDDRRIKQSVRLLHAEGVSVFALSGEPRWAIHHGPALRWANRVQRLAPFDGIHLDVEPYALKQWKSDQQAVIADYLGLLDEVTALPGPLDVDVQFAMGRIATPTGFFGDDILSRVDGVTVMSYRNVAFGGNSMWEIAQDWLSRATAAGRPIWLAAETNEVPGCPHCTFHDLGQAAMADVLGQVDAAAKEQFPTYQGFAVEDLDGWLALGP